MLKIRFIILLVASGLSKGYSYIMAPVIFSLFGAVLLGNYVMITTLSLLMSQVISLNPTAVIIRNSDNDVVCTQYTYYYYLFSLTNFFVASGVYLIFNLISVDKYLVLVWLLASAEALLLVVIAYFRAKDLYIRFLLVTLLKCLFLGVYLFFYAPGLQEIILFSASLSFLLSVIFVIDKFFLERVQLHIGISRFRLDSVIGDLLFGVKLIPHSFGLWGFSSAAKVILNLTAGAVALGFFSIYLTFSFPLVLVNSALTLFLPREIVRDPIGFIDKKRDLRLFVGYSLFVLLIIVMLAVFCYFDGQYSFYIDSYSLSTSISIYLCCLVFYNFGTYQFLANYLFYSKDASALSKNTLISAFISIVLSFILSYFFAVIGVVIALYSASFYYVYNTFRLLRKSELNNNSVAIWGKFCVFSPCLLFVCCLLGVLVK